MIPDDCPFGRLLVLASLGLVLLSSAVTAWAAEEPKMEFLAVPVLQKQSCLAGEELPFALRLRNIGSDTSSVGRPRAQEISFKVGGPDKGKYKVAFAAKEPGPMASAEIWLEPDCAIEVGLGTVTLKRADAPAKPVPVGRYTLTVSWEPKNAAGVARGELKPQCHIEVNEYPLDVRLSQPVPAQGGHVPLAVSFSNRGGVPIKLLNYFSPYKDVFDLDVRRVDAPADAGEKEPYPKAKVTPDADSGWVMLMPGESLLVDFDAAEEFKAAGRYETTITYTKSIVLLPPGEKPRNSTQSRWCSGEISVTIGR